MRLDRFQRWAVATTAATYGLIGVGGLVRASGAGLGCPDWPKCFGHWFPPRDASQLPPSIDPSLFNPVKMWTEYVNRSIGVSIGLLILTTLVLAILHHRRDRRIVLPAIAAFVLVGYEGWLGGRVVAAKLDPLVLSLHLACALLIVGLLLCATTAAFFAPGRSASGRSPREAWRRTVARSSAGVAAIALLQAAVGAALRGEVQLAARRAPAAPRALWLHAIGTIRIVHEGAALIVVALVTALGAYVLRRASPRDPLRPAATASIGMAWAQAAVGIGLSSFALPASLQVVHLGLGSLLLGALFVLGLIAHWAPGPDAMASRGQAPEWGEERGAVR